MRRAALLAVLSVAAAACGPHQKYAAAAVTAGVAVAAAAINRAATGACWASCPQGSRCDKATGACVPLPCQDACPADAHCAVLEGRETCVPGGQDTSSPSEIPPEQESASKPRPALSRAPDPCRGLCFPSEQCVEKGGVADCVPRRAQPLPASPP